jgi:hypothetical protein
VVFGLAVNERDEVFAAYRNRQVPPDPVIGSTPCS